MGDQKGFAHIALIVALVMLVIASVSTIRIVKNSITPTPTLAPVNSNKLLVASPSAKASPFSKPATDSKVTKTPIPAIVKTPVPITTPTSTPTSGSSSTSDNSCPYDVNSPSGAIEVQIKPKNDLVIGDQIVELQAKNGCKVLGGSDKQIEIARSRGQGYSSMNWANYSAVPAGSYSVRIQYKGEWTSYTNVDAVSVQRKIVEFTVEGSAPAPTPTATPKPKPICSIFVSPGSVGTAPFGAKVCVGNSSNPYQEIKQELVDYDGNGSWDYQGASYGCHDYTFQNPGTYTPKAKIISTSDEGSDDCQTSVTIN